MARASLTEGKKKITWSENLAAAIVLQAVEDYRLAKKKIVQFPTYEGIIMESKSRMDECELFFRSDWFGVLTTIDPEALIKRLKTEKMSPDVRWRM